MSKKIRKRREERNGNDRGKGQWDSKWEDTAKQVKPKEISDNLSNNMFVYIPIQCKYFFSPFKSQVKK